MVPVLLFVSGLDHRAAHPRNGTVSARAKMLPENPQPGIVGRSCRWGRFALDPLAWTPAEPNAPAANFARVADLPDSVVFRFTVCEW